MEMEIQFGIQGDKRGDFCQVQECLIGLPDPFILFSDAMTKVSLGQRLATYDLLARSYFI